MNKKDKKLLKRLDKIGNPDCEHLNKRTKCSENGIYTWCVDCLKTFEWSE